MEYEFNETENKTFLQFIQRQLLLSITMLITGVIMLIQGIIPETVIAATITGTLFIVLAVQLFFPIQSFLNIIVTSGDDMTEFLKGIKSLSAVVTIILGASIFTLISIIVTTISLISQ